MTTTTNPVPAWDPGVSLRDYFIGCAPAEPHCWFEPTMPKMSFVLPCFEDVQPEALQAELRLGRRFDQSSEATAWWVNFDEARVAEKEYLFDRQKEYVKQSYVQWPAAWADAMMEARGRREEMKP